eukprot:CAMPEP_0181314734 /NCGR_PEP_ID=MMETSP1101-20121128/14980_1 /TAXON_ID=46948 /ORGANISM="Rhodomonas abbreviata, Strain Caron Lab Isolate" /LENGTH=234 /DNA_ID=CAMNT_0023421855 /DNA_START=8 /DNA_END=712 /DNA_ORIENTATION=-
MAASKDFSFEEPPRGPHGSSPLSDKNAALSASVPDFSAFADIDLGSVSPAMGRVDLGKTYKPMSKGAEYMFDEEEKNRSFGEHLVFYTGSCYLTGVGSGITVGLFEGLRKGRELPSSKLRMNAVVNACSKRAPMFGNNLGVLALLFATSERTSQYIRDKDDMLNPIIGAASTGFLFKCSSGPRACIAWTLMGGVGMSLVTLSGYATTVLHRTPFRDTVEDYTGVKLPAFGRAAE